MKITDITSYPVWGGHRNYLFVVVDTDEGIYGVGEAGLTGRELAVMGAIDHFKPLLIGQDPGRIEYLWQMLSRGGFFPHGKILGSAIAAIDIALWDIRGKALGVPVYDLLGGRVRDKVVCYCHLAIPNFAVQEQPRQPGTALTDVVGDQPVFEDGYILAPTAPGLGVTFDREAAQAHPFQMTELPHLRREDGGFTNW